ncbi:hypothetical protein DLM45_10510 [Hyphomicrobium methylovorum]|uniref:hypothetical protein n=1 Tax=Hyphomicrobium methylovorum TaxID=84 RepID=UPI0015E778E1|nr:hypothetical protein [Hyphomicrobium methylovorum]MBA2126649.1 hypothetical protein [Hyphomicrobium methylovorum]
MLPDDVFRERLESTLVELETWAETTRHCADIDIGASPRYWRIEVVPHFSGACPFALMLSANQTFTLELAGERHSDLPIEHFDLFPRLARAVRVGNVERIETLNALTKVLLMVEMRVSLGDNRDWIGQRRIVPQNLDVLLDSEERTAHRFLAYER